ncbi:uridine kinase [Verruconis gallopava]|uniref:Uridine kinase n=1 Tax=Verruconis gallopava TaxID=253628 RepID=A0A0D2A5X6_9PEZI|nr:uridine kinase [Verruconis gallopava]KIW01935.1 uridine kinase [Verruconis gallopava]
MSVRQRKNSITQRAHYCPPWNNTSIIGVAGSSGSGKTSLALAVVSGLNLPWVVILSMDSFYKQLTPEQSKAAFRNEFDFDSPDAIDFDLLVEKLREIKEGKKVEVPVYSFEKHAREERTSTIYSPHVLILEGIFALHDQRILDMLDLKVFAEADPDVCLSRRVLRDVRYRGRDVEGCMKQWFAFVKPNFHKYVHPQREVADIIVPRGIENKVAIRMISDQISKTLKEKSKMHQLELSRLGKNVENNPLSENVILLPQRRQILAIHTLLMSPTLPREEFIFYFDRVVVNLIERATACQEYQPTQIMTSLTPYIGLEAQGEVSAVVILRGGSALETGLKRVIPDCRTGRLLIQTNYRTGEPELHYLKLPNDLDSHGLVLLLDAQMSSGGAALMAVKVLVDHGVPEEKIVFVSYMAGKIGIGRLMSVFPDIRVVVGRIVDDQESRWVEERYLGC